MPWLADGSRASLADALRVVAPGLGDTSIEVRASRHEDDPLWWSGTAIVDAEYVAKFAWSRPAAVRLAHEIAVVTALAGVPFLPEIVASGADPVLLVSRRVSGVSLFAAAPGLDPERAGGDLARFLAALHDPATRARLEAAVGELPDARQGPEYPRGSQHPRALPPRQEALVARWRAWAAATLERPGQAAVAVHADLHGDNQVWAGGSLKLVVDFENVSSAEPEYDLRALPATGVPLLTATIRHYEHSTGRRVDVERVMAWHLRTVLADAAWRLEAGVPLPGDRTLADWFDDLAALFDGVGIETRNA